MKQALVFCLGTLIFFTACKKDKDPTLIGKWNVESNTYKVYSSSTLVTQTTPGNGATMNFVADGPLILTDSTGDQNLQYKILPNSKVIIEKDTYGIKNLSASAVTLLLHQDFGLDYVEINVNLKR
jgi:hypothetical protein